MGKFIPPEDENERRDWIKRQKAKGVRAFKCRTGWMTSTFGAPSNPQTDPQQDHRYNVRAVSARWHTLTPDQQGAWRARAANSHLITETGQPARRNCYNWFVSLNTRRADLGLSQFDVPPAQPVFPELPVEELALTYPKGKFTLQFRLRGTPTQLILMGGPKPVSAGIRCVQHFPFLGSLPPPIGCWSNITELYVAQYGVPKPGQAIWICVWQHIDGFIDVPVVFRLRVEAPPA